MLRGVFEGLVADRKPLRLASFPRRFDACLQRGLQEGLGRERGKEVGRSRGRFSMLLATRIKRHTDGDFIGKRKSVAAWVLLDVRINCAPYGRAEVASPFRGGGFPLFSIESSRPRPVEKATREDARQTACLRSNLDINPLKRRRLFRFISHANGDPVRELKLSRGAALRDRHSLPLFPTVLRLVFGPLRSLVDTDRKLERSMGRVLITKFGGLDG